MDRSPIENNTRPTLRGTSTCFRGSPGGSKVPTTYPPYPLFILVHLFATCGKNFNGMQRYIGLIGNLSPVGRKLLYHVLYWFAEGVARLSLGVVQCCAGLVWFAYLPTILVCCLSDAFVTRFSYLWQTKGHTLIHS